MRWQKDFMLFNPSSHIQRVFEDVGPRSLASTKEKGSTLSVEPFSLVEGIEAENPPGYVPRARKTVHVRETNTHDQFGDF